MDTGTQHTLKGCKTLSNATFFKKVTFLNEPPKDFKKIS